MGDPEPGADGVCERVVRADERVRECETGKGGGIGHVGARGQIVRIVVHPRQRLEDQARGLDTERVGVGRGEDGGHRLQRVGEGVDSGVDRQCAWHREGEHRVHDRHVRNQGVVDQGLLAAGDGEDGRR